METSSQGKRSYRRIIFSILTTALLILVYFKFAELQLLKNFFRQSSWPYLGAIISIQLLTYLFNSFNYQDILKMKGFRIPFWNLYLIEFVLQFISQAIPTAHISGQVFFVYYLKRYGVSLKDAIGRAILEVTTLYIAYITFFVAAAILLFRSQALQKAPELTLFIYGFVIFIIVCGIVFFLSQERRSETWIDWFLDRTVQKFKHSRLSDLPGLRTLFDHGEHLSAIKEQFRDALNWRSIRERWTLMLRACLWQELWLLSNVFILWIISYAIGAPIPFIACFVAFTFSKFLSMISIIPGAPGIFEGAMSLILITFGIDAGPALAATLLTRAFTFWLPMPIGWFLYGHYMKQGAVNDKPAIS